MGNDSPSRLIAGAMSGTSADGVDVALTRVTGRGLDMRAQLVRHHHRPYDAALRGAIFHLRDTSRASLAELARLAREISMTYALTVNEALVAAHLRTSDLTAVAAHGQTLFHDPPNTIQWFDPALVAAEVGCPVVSDFRRADLAAGGQGAPLVPFADYILFRHPTKTRVLLNIGGIANMTVLKAGCRFDEVIAYDTGPGNCISDYLCRTMDPTGPGYDVNGALAAQGQEIGLIEGAMLGDPYFSGLPPKSTDGPEMIAAFERARKASHFDHPLPDLLREACGITVSSIVGEIATVCRPLPDEVIVSGGGVKNRFLMGELDEFMQDVSLCSTDTLGVPADAKEALAFALLAAATLDGEPSN